MRSLAYVDVQSTHVARTEGEFVAARSVNAEKVPHALNMVPRICVVPIPFGGNTHHVQIFKLCPRFYT